jgi:four helix bundle protein
MSRDHKKLEIFVLADQLALEVYGMTSSFPLEERFGLQTQVRRAAVSAASNILEGAARSTDRAFAHFLDMAAGSAAEARYLIDLASRLGYVDSARGCIRRLRRSPSAQPEPIPPDDRPRHPRRGLAVNDEP